MAAPIVGEKIMGATVLICRSFAKHATTMFTANLKAIHLAPRRHEVQEPESDHDDQAGKK